MYKRQAGDRDAGIRLEVPRSLQNSLKALEAVSFALKKNNPALRRNVKFDDEAEDLLLDFNLDPDGGKPWRRLMPAQAKAMRSKLRSEAPGAQEVGEDELDSMMGQGTTAMSI